MVSGVPAGALLRAPVVMVSAVGAMVRLKPWETAVPAASITCKVNWEVPAAMGVPVMAPSPMMVSPAGSAPPVWLKI